jgi:hypothetical protein
MSKMLLIAASMLFGLAAIPAGAIPLSPLPDHASSIALAAQGCGVGWYRGPYGHCHPMGYVAPVYVAPVYGAPVYGGPGWGPGHCWRGYYGHLHCN